MKLLSNIVAGLFGLILICLMIVATEFTLKYLYPNSNDLKQSYSIDPWEKQPGVIFWNRRNTNINAVAKLGDKTIFDVTYSIDSLGRRKSTNYESKERDQFVAFFGGSHTFGQGIEDDETLSAKYSRLTPQSNVYNYAVSGTGPSHMLARIKQPGFKDEIKGKNGQFFFVMYLYAASAHFERTMGSAFITSGWSKGLPNFEVVDGKVIRRGRLYDKERSFLLKSAPKFIISSHIFQLLNANFYYSDFVYTEKDFQDFAKIIKEAELSLKEFFPNASFDVVIHPYSRQKNVDTIVPFLKKSGINVVNFNQRTIDLLREPGHLIPVDEHPTGKYNAILAGELFDKTQKFRIEGEDGKIQARNSLEKSKNLSRR